MGTRFTIKTLRRCGFCRKDVRCGHGLGEVLTDVPLSRRQKVLKSAHQVRNFASASTS